MNDERLRAEGTIDEIKGKAKTTIGRATGDKQTEAEGRLDEVKGNIKEGIADVKDKVEDVVQDIRDR